MMEVRIPSPSSTPSSCCTIYSLLKHLVHRSTALVIEERSLYVDMDPAIGTRTLPLAQVLGNFQMGCCGPEPREIEQGAVFSSKNERA
mmetsp:Transcript_10514/g.18025  ORF Transcript_10514/g.18025 Transcript_10514/m.18025 type:complete len:88 (-) Transcript_10514:1181-1444(-)